MKKYFALGMVAIFLLGFFLGRETNSNSPSPSIQAPLTKPPEATINKTDSVQTKTDIQCFIEALIISIYPNTALRLNNCKAAHVDVLKNGFKKLAAKDNGKDVLNALTSYLDSDVDLGDFVFFINLLGYQLSLDNRTIAGCSKNWILYPYNLLNPYASLYPEAYYYSALGNLYGYKPSKIDCETALEFYNEYRKLGGNIEIKFEDICKD